MTRCRERHSLLGEVDGARSPDHEAVDREGPQRPGLEPPELEANREVGRHARGDAPHQDLASDTVAQRAEQVWDLQHPRGQNDGRRQEEREPCCGSAPIRVRERLADTSRP